MGDSFSVNNKLGRRITLYILICSMLLSIASSAVQLLTDFNEDVKSLEKRLDSIQYSYLESIATSLWDFNDGLLITQINGIEKLPDVRFVKISTELGNEYQAGNPNVVFKQTRAFPIQYGETQIGTLFVGADYQDISQRLKHRAGFIVVIELLKALVIAICIIFIVHWSITRHIFNITHYAQQMNSTTLDEALVLNHRPKNKDELDELVDALNLMRQTLKEEIQKLEQAENALIDLNSDLEIKVYERTSKLAEANRQLQQSLDDLTLAKDQLVQSEKMASLGQLVAGVAHEVNTPLGICVTSISAMKERVEQLKQSIENQQLTKSDLMSTLDLLTEYQSIIERSIDKAVNLIRSFKSVAVEQHTDAEMTINFSHHINDVITTVKTMFKRKDYRIHIDVPKDLLFTTYPSAWNQIITNFLMNSHIHGFENQSSGDIYISCKRVDDWIIFDYRDNGKGINQEIKQHIFDPFVTTKRGKGGSGLGLNIVFNLVDVKLQGRITCLDTKQGCHFQIKVPLKHQR